MLFELNESEQVQVAAVLADAIRQHHHDEQMRRADAVAKLLTLKAVFLKITGNPAPPFYCYEIEPRAIRLGGGFRLRLLEDYEEMGGGVFPSLNDPTDPDDVQARADAEDEGNLWLASRPNSDGTCNRSSREGASG